VYAGEIVDISFRDYWLRLVSYSLQAANPPS
jgi:hypothetical protein